LPLKYIKDGLQFELPLWRPEVLLDGGTILESVGEHHYANRIIMEMVICYQSKQNKAKQNKKHYKTKQK
jgi:hypothetical protein